MIEALISSKTRIKLLLKFFLNSNTTAYLRSLESEFGDSTNGIRVELNKMEDVGMLISYNQGNRKYFKANPTFPLYKEINSILQKHFGFDQIIESVIKRLGEVERVYVTGNLSKGIDSQIIDLVIVGNVDKDFLYRLIEKAEKLISRKIRYVVLNSSEADTMSWNQENNEPFLLWNKE